MGRFLAGGWLAALRVLGKAEQSMEGGTVTFKK
jgi:hypothetical protein